MSGDLGLPPNVPRSPVWTPAIIVKRSFLVDLRRFELILGNRLLQRQLFVPLILILAADVDDVLLLVGICIEHFAISNSTFKFVGGHAIKHGDLRGSRRSSSFESRGHQQ